MQPLLHAQATYIDQLEQELSQKAYKLTNLEGMIDQMHSKHENDHAEMVSKFNRIDSGYREDAAETQRQLHLMQLEREDNERLVQLYRTQNEVLDT